MLGLTEYLLIIVAGVFLAIQFLKPKKNLPPGPPGLPFFGNMFQVEKDQCLKEFAWAKEYGKIYTIKLPMKTIIMINDLALAKEVNFDNDFVSRPKLPIFELFTDGPYGILFTSGKHWEEQRRWCLRKLRDFGFGKTSMEGIIMDEVNELADYFKKNQGKTMQISDRFSLATLNSLWTILAGKRLPQDDPKLRKFMTALDHIIPVIAKSGFVFLPWLMNIRRDMLKQIKGIANDVVKFSAEAMDEHLKNHDENNSGDFVDEYITEIKKTTDPSSSFYQDIGKKNLVGVISDLIQAGSETTSNTINWAICYLTHYPEKMAKIHEELDAVVGSRQISLSDKPALPYTQAVIMETMRMSPIASTGVWHVADVEKEVAGYTIPKDAWVLTNIYAIHHDPKVWGDAEEFRPERFLSPDGKKVIKNENLIPFQIGRRQCLGESLAKDTLFLFISTILQRFEITKVEKEKPTHVDSMFLFPLSYNFIFKSREQA